MTKAARLAFKIAQAATANGKFRSLLTCDLAGQHSALRQLCLLSSRSRGRVAVGAQVRLEISNLYPMPGSHAGSQTARTPLRLRLGRAPGARRRSGPIRRQSATWLSASSQPRTRRTTNMATGKAAAVSEESVRLAWPDGAQ